MKYYFYLLLLASTFIANAQLKESYKKGWIEKNNLTKNGFIESNDIEKLSKSICFKTDLESECQNFNPNQITSFSLGNGDTYDALHLKLNNKTLEIDLFANLILKGEKISLYKSSYKSEIFYAVSKNGKNYVLQNDKLAIGESEITRYNYQGVLNFITEGIAFNENRPIKFSEDNFIRIINKFNDLKGLTSQDLRVEEKSVNYYLINAGLGFKENVTEYYAQGMVRKYFPKLSRSTSLNFGVLYFNYTSKEADDRFNISLVSVPLHIQQNLSNKKIRPYLFAGVALNYSQTTNENGDSLKYQGFQKTNGVNFPYGIGIEIDIYKAFYFKSEYRDELFTHPLLFGIGYALSK